MCVPILPVCLLICISRMLNTTPRTIRIVVGLTGTIGSGKGAVVDRLVGRHGFVHYSARNFLLGELRRRKELISDRLAMSNVANSLRAEHGSAYIVETLFMRALSSPSERVIIESIRDPLEIEALKRLGKSNFVLLAVDAKIHTRYVRVKARKSETDQVSFDEFVFQEKLEMDNVEPGKQNLRKCIQAADHQLCNDGSLFDLNKSVDGFVGRYFGN
jgi:dephospho-CoA kinase